MIPSLSGRALRTAAVLATGFLAACAQPPAKEDIPDPLEPMNRGLYAVNVGFDKTVLKPISDRMGETGRGGFFRGLSNFAENLDTPTWVLNDLLQGKVMDAAQNTLRFGVNTVFGLGGILDPADDMGLYAKETDFGATMFTYGVDEGWYLVLPFYGPSSTRDASGLLIDDVIDPLQLVVPTSTLWIGTVAQLADQFGSRMRHAETVDSLLYDSADGYAQARLLYQQYRQHELGQTPPEASFVDPYEDSYGQ